MTRSPLANETTDTLEGQRSFSIFVPVKLRDRGMELHDAVITGASVRLRAELLSALIGSISLIPFIISSGTGAEIEKPLAIVVVGGMLMSPIKIVILPMIYEWVERRAARKTEVTVA